MVENDDDWLSIMTNIKKEKSLWSQLSKLLKCPKISRKNSSLFFKTVVQKVLLYGSETWVMSGMMKNKLYSFHDGVARSLSDVKGEYDTSSQIYKKAPIGMVSESIYMDSVEDYIKKRKQTLHSTITQDDYDRSLLRKFTESQCGRKLVWWR